MSWLGGIGTVAGRKPILASGDASFRRYFRLQGNGESFIVMDAPPAQEDCLPFMRIAGYLEAMQLNAPRILEADPERGFLLMTDLGTTQYLDALISNPQKAPAMYTDALTALARLQHRGAAYQALLPPYDEELLRSELSLFHDWLCGNHLGIEFDADEEMAWQEVCTLLVENALEQPQVFVHRDYHSRNLMVTTSNNPGILDFQDAVEGPLTYDLVSLLKDCYIRWPAEQLQGWMHDFYAGLDESTRELVDQEQFTREFELMGVQRHLKAAGIFARLNHRDGKPDYLHDIPRTLQYVVELLPRHAELEFLVTLIHERCLPMLEDKR